MIAGLLPRSRSRNVAYTIMLAALAVALSPISIPIGIAKISPTQHMVNVLASVLIGPWWGLACAAITSAVRLMLGLGTPLAFPGSMIGVLIAGLTYQRPPDIRIAALGEALGTGVLGALAGALLVAPYIMGKELALGGLMLPFALSAGVGALLGLAALGVLRRAGLLDEPRR